MRRVLVIFSMLMWMLPSSAAETTKSFDQHIDGLEHKAGFFDLYIDAEAGSLLAALPQPDAQGTSLRVIYSTGLTAGLGSNPIGLDRGRASSGIILRFRKIGPNMVAEQENWRYRASANRPEEELAVAQSFANSFLWSSEILATAPDGRVLIDLGPILVRDQFGLADSLKHGEDAGGYSLATDRSFANTDRVLVFPDNVELDAYLTFESQKPNAETRATAPDARAVTLELHHSFVRLPDAGYTPRKYDQRTANIGLGFYDFSSPLAEPIVQRLSRRFRLQKQNPNAAMSPPKKPIVFYVDAGAPVEIREALIEGASWWAEGFEAAGFQDAYRVEVLPADAHPLDVRYNVINWVHRQTRGWSYGGSVSDPRTGEILKANVILGSQRVRQDRMIFEGLAGVAQTGTGSADDPVEISLARIRQLSAHEVGHTLGFAHNFAASSNDRASVMDYPAPYIRPRADDTLDFSDAYATGLGDWDIFTVKWLYSEFADSTVEDAELNTLVEAAHDAGLRFTADRHGRSVGSAQPFGSVWDNGADAVETLLETLKVREIGLQNFGPNRLAAGRAASDLNAVIVPIYLYHRYQVPAAAKYIGGLDFQYAVNGDGRSAATPVSEADQRRALSALLATVEPARLDLPDAVLNLLTPGDVGYAGGGQKSLEVFPVRTGPVFDLLGAADIAANLTFSALLHPARLERIMAYEQRGSGGFTLPDMMETVSDAVFADTTSSRHVLLAQTVQARFVMSLAAVAGHAEISAPLKATLEQELATLRSRLTRRWGGRTPSEKAHNKSLIRLIDATLAGDAPALQTAPKTPQGSPIGMGEIAETCWHCDPL